VNSSEYAGVTLDAGTRASFDSRLGRTDSGTVARWHAGPHYGTQVVLHASGRARVCATGAAMNRYPGC
jgi:hypothetical protein